MTPMNNRIQPAHINIPDSQWLGGRFLEWYRQNARDLPWRKTKDPYAIWVSEVMLQQTRVETVIPYYQRFLAQFPTLKSLAEAQEQQVLKAWEGLGYYRRVRLLQQGAKEVLNKFAGELPADPELLAGLPGVGSYMSGALASIAFNLPVPAVDGNVIRVVTRILAWEQVADSARSRRVITDWVQRQFPNDAAGDFTQSLMEIGALICLPRNPRCQECPVRLDCQANTQGNPERFPIKKEAQAIPVERRIVLRINWDGRRLLMQRPATGLLAGFWEYPNLLSDPDDLGDMVASAWTEQNLGRALPFKLFTKTSQVFTHRRWDIEIWEADWLFAEIPNCPDNSVWVSQPDEQLLPKVAFLR
jgi:A/G-specific adenine glycosylase